MLGGQQREWKYILEKPSVCIFYMWYEYTYTYTIKQWEQQLTEKLMVIKKYKN